MSLLTLLPFLSITIDIDPVMFDAGPFTLTWHGLFTAVGILCGVTLSVWLCKKDGIPTETGQEIALVAVPCAIIGARLFYVFEHWDRFENDIPSIITDIQEGGITLYGGLIGGVVGGLAYGLIRRLPIAICLDAAAPGMILGQALGRIGDLINGEHLADRTSLPWGVKYVHPDSPQYKVFEDSRRVGGDLAPLDSFPVHPTAGGYELLGDLIILGLLLYVARRWVKTPGWTFAIYMALYGVLRFALSFTRNDEQKIADIPVPMLVSALVVGGAMMVAAALYRWPGPITREYAERVWGHRSDPDNSPDDAAPPPRRRGPART
ncbi:MAG: prolipoprotein diacylglyceryl transferase [Dehalococcoidia bacterium]